MELEEFIEKTLLQIFNGVCSAQPEVKKLGGTINPFDKDYTDKGGNLLYMEYSKKRYIDFEVSLTESNKNEANAGIGVLLGVVSIGGKGNKGNENISLTKVKFSIPVFYPVNKTL